MDFIWPQVFVNGRRDACCDQTLKADLLEMQALLLLGQKPPEKFGEGCSFIASRLGMQAVNDAMNEVTKTLMEASK